MKSEKGKKALLKRIRVALAVLVVGLVASGLTAFPLELELNFLVCQLLGLPSSAAAADYTGLVAWLVTVRNGLHSVYADFPWMAYGTDWLAFAHLILAVLFVGPLKDPVRNRWVIDFGVIACLGVFPLALICGQLRGIPFYWRLVDCSFGFFGLFPLLLARKWASELEVCSAQPGAATEASGRF